MAQLVASPRLTRDIARIYAALWAFTLAVAIIVASLGELGHTTRGMLDVRLDGSVLPRDLRAAAGLWWRNASICGWPVLIALAPRRWRIGDRVVCSVVALTAALNAMVVGAALGAYGLALTPYLPQLPLEWLGLAAGAAPWLGGVWTRPTRAELVTIGALGGLALAAAALLEVYATPGR